MAFITDKEELKSGFIIFRRGERFAVTCRPPHAELIVRSLIVRI